MNKISIIIPVLNEVDHIENLLKHLFKNASKNLSLEIICIDGGSNDGTQNIISKFNNVTLLNSKKGRAKQMNLGAKKATGDILYFLHADSFPPKDFDTLILNEIKKGNFAGCFRMQFNSNHLWLKLAGWLTALPWRISRGGDQSLFITQELFNDIGGYDEQFIIYEDNDLINKLYKKKQFVVIPKWLKTSARCYQKYGVFKTQYHFWRIHIKSKLGAKPSELKSYYKENLVNS